MKYFDDIGIITVDNSDVGDKALKALADKGFVLREMNFENKDETTYYILILMEMDDERNKKS